MRSHTFPSPISYRIIWNVVGKDRARKSEQSMGPRGHKPSGGNAGRRPRGEPSTPVGVRIIGGRFRGRKLEYTGDLRTRPMKDRVRESLFNRLGPTVRGKTAVDLFAGTGALGFEALSRGATRAIFIEQHLPTALAIRRTAVTLQTEDAIEVVTANTFFWFRRQGGLGSLPLAVFCSPPYDFYVDRLDEMLALLRGLIAAAPPESVFVVESDGRFDFNCLPEPEQWDVRPTLPAIVGIFHKEG